MNTDVFSRERTLFLVWAAATDGSSRSRHLAQELGIRELHHVGMLRGTPAWTAPLRYALQGLRTLGLLVCKRPGLVVVQSPPSHAVLVVRLCCRITGAGYIVDAHSDAFQRSVWRKPSWLHDPAVRDALVTLVHDDSFQPVVEARGGRALVLKDPIGRYDWEDYPLQDGFNIAVVNRFAPDEPIEQVLRAAARIPSVRFHVTGDPQQAPPGLLERAPKNVTFTGFLPSRRYYGLLRSSQAVMALTTRDHTFQCGANEALSLERPVITSAWQTLRDYFPRGAVFVDNSEDGILEGVREMVSRHETCEGEIRELRRSQRADWENRVDELAAIVEAGERAPRRVSQSRPTPRRRPTPRA